MPKVTEIHLLMDCLTFISNIVGSLAWPATVVFSIFLMRHQIRYLLPRLKQFKYKDTEMEFTQGIVELTSEYAEETSTSLIESSSDTIKEQFNFLIKLADISPRSAVLEAFRTLEIAAAKKAMQASPETNKYISGSLVHLSKLLEGVLDQVAYQQFNKLRKLRNQAAHAAEFDVSGKLIQNYIDLALSLAARLERDGS